MVGRDAAAKRIHLNPLGGYQGPVQLTRAFLLTPNVMLRLSGYSLSAAWNALGAESTIKTLEYHRVQGNELPQRLVKQFIRLLPWPDAQALFREAFDAVGRGEDVSFGPFEEHGLWEDFLYGRWWGTPEDERPYPTRYLQSLLRTLRQPEQDFEAQNFPDVARALSRNELTRDLAPPEVLFALAGASSRPHATYAQWSVALEAAISQLAAWCAGLGADQGTRMVEDITYLMAGDGEKSGSLVRQFHLWLMRKAGQKSMGALVEKLSHCGVPIHPQTLKRWSSGKTLPDSTNVKNIAKQLFPNEEEYAMSLLWALRYLSLLGHVTEKLIGTIAPHLSSPGACERFAPWPVFPWGYQSFHCWAVARLRFWHRYHIGRLAAGS